IETDLFANIAPGVSSRFPIKLRNPFSKPLKFDLKVSANTGLPIRIKPKSQMVELGEKEMKEIEASIELQSSDDGEEGFRDWTIFTYVDPGKVNLSQTKDIPKSVAGLEGNVAAKSYRPIRNTIDFEKSAGGLKRQAAALAFVEYYSEKDQSITLGASADWWMECYVNGVLAYSTMDDGNGGGYTVLDHTFRVDVKKGKNLIAIKVLSGAAGWKLLLGGPKDLEKAKGISIDQIEIQLESNGKLLAKEFVKMNITTPVPLLKKGDWNLSIDTWDSVPSEIELTEIQVTNLYDKHPDQSRWWQGDQDLSGRVWFRGDSEHLYIAVQSNDDYYQKGTEAKSLWKSDSLQIAFTKPGDMNFDEYTIGQIEEEVTVYKHKHRSGLKAGKLPANNQEIEARIKRSDKKTFYFLKVDRQLFGRGAVSLNLLINDNDSGEREQFIQWRPGLGESKDTSLWKTISLPNDR
ncbi:MAG: hypothetical protein AAF558_10365, partial [Verrucomicrobiota bacterium]